MMLTRCPGCTTTFRVTPEQVKARQGQVRCGRCQHAFNAIEYLVEAEPVPIVTSATVAPVEPSIDTTASEGLVDAAVVEVQAMPEPDTESEASEALEDDAASHAEAQPETVAEEAPPSEPSTAEADALPAENILLQPSPLSAAYGPPSSLTEAPRWPWLIAALLGALVLLAQAMISFRGDLAAQYPQTLPILELLCEKTGCVIELPSNPELVSIESSDLHPGKKGGLELTATLRNRATGPQAWPYLELTLTDGADKPIVRKVIAPAQYLPADQTEADGFASNGELALQLALDAGKLPAAGYRLYLFYP